MEEYTLQSVFLNRYTFSVLLDRTFPGTIHSQLKTVCKKKKNVPVKKLITALQKQTKKEKIKNKPKPLSIHILSYLELAVFKQKIY